MYKALQSTQFKQGRIQKFWKGGILTCNTNLRIKPSKLVRLRPRVCITLGYRSWGWTTVVFFLGDDVQLPPVYDTPVYFSKGKSAASMHGLLAWKEFQHFVYMQTLIRQNNDQQQFKNVLAALRDNTSNSLDIHVHWLQRFQWNNHKM